MSLQHGRHYLAIPGPSVMPDRVLQAMHQPAPNIYAGSLVKMVEGLIPDLCAVARTKHDVAIYICNGHGTWEASLSNVAGQGDTVLVIDTGHFAKGWAHVARSLGVKVKRFKVPTCTAPDLDALADVLKSDGNKEIKAVLAVHVDTSTGLRTDIDGVRKAMDAAGHPALLMADCVASLGCDRFEMDAWGVDVTITASQKGLMTPPGMGFVYFNDKAKAVRKSMPRVSQYWDWSTRVQPKIFYEYFRGTAPTHHLFGLREALTMLVEEEGVEAAWARHEHLAQAIWAAFDTWGEAGPLRIMVADKAVRSHAITALEIGAPYGSDLQTWVTENAGVTLGIGLGVVPPDSPDWHGYFRLGHMGHVNAQMIMGVLGSIDAGLKALDVPHADGGLSAASAVIARA